MAVEFLDRMPPPDYDSNGVDRTLIRAYLRNTPLECLELLEEMQQLAESVDDGPKPILTTD